MRSNLHRTFKTRSQRQDQDQTKEQKQLTQVNYATENENQQDDQNALKKPCCPENRYRNKILSLKRSLLYRRALEFLTLQPQLEWCLDCLRLRSPEMFIRRLHLLRFILQSQYRLCPLQWNSKSSINSELQRHL